MIRFVIDTDLFSLYLNGDPVVKAYLLAVPADEVAITAVTVSELAQGWLAQIHRHSVKGGTALWHAYDRLAQLPWQLLGKNITTVVARWSQPYQDVMQAGLITEGQRVQLEYRPRGQQKRTFEGILRERGVEVDGQVMSLSAAAVHCIQKAGGHRPTANGWTMWKTSEFHMALGQFLDYRVALEEQQPERVLYMAVPLDTYKTFFNLPFTQTVTQRYQLKLVVYDVERELIVQWQE